MTTPPVSSAFAGGIRFAGEPNNVFRIAECRDPCEEFDPHFVLFTRFLIDVAGVTSARRFRFEWYDVQFLSHRTKGSLDMFKTRYLFPAFMLFGALPSASQAQSSVPLATTTYSVQVRYEHWRSGGGYWSTVFTTEDAEDAELMLELLEVALENHRICEIVGGCTFDYFISDVRLVSKTVFRVKPVQPDILRPRYQKNLQLFKPIRR